ncbi:DMT family transporter [Arenibaculum sp.]|jgi:drug/metabolite transporter (DMT)-like permease|uniref:DMT family transporter n=1 Tax=Arenibaculum sp. TaxID=2865862 RepID=UPI002E147674|nr:DMT family transporter [Arenibaculum sp.]
MAAGVAAALLTVSIWAGWIVATRHSVSTGLGPVDLGLLRFGVPALLLAPAWLKVGLLPRGVPLRLVALMVAGSGAPFLLIGSSGLGFAPASHAGVLMPGTMPLWAGLIGWALLGERLGPPRVAGYGLIAGGVAVLEAAALAGAGDAWRGHLLFVLCAAMWAAYTHAFRRSGLSAFQAAGMVAAWSLAVHLALAAVLGTDLFSTPSREVAIQAAVQGGLSGLVAIVAYGFAVRRLGATRAAAFSALAPALAAFGGMALLGEAPGPAGTAAALVVGLGVLLAAGAPRLRGDAASSGHEYLRVKE